MTSPSTSPSASPSLGSVSGLGASGKWQGVYEACRNLVEKTQGRVWYPYQRKAARRIIKSLVNGESEEIAVLVSRQSGKSTMTADLIYALSVILPMAAPDRFGQGFRAGLFAPKKEQAQDIIFAKAKKNFDSPEARIVLSAMGITVAESNGNTFSLSNSSQIICLTASTNATITGRTLDLAIMDEAQDIDENKIVMDIYPMTSSTGGTRVLIGTPNFQVGYLYKVCEARKGTPEVIITPYTEVVEEKRYVWEKTGDRSHLEYAKSVEKDRKRWGDKDDRFRTQYLLEWITERAMVITEAQLYKCRQDYKPYTKTDKDVPVWVGIDLGKVTDSTVVTIVGNHDPETGVHYPSTTFVYAWLELLGDNYERQFDTIVAFLRHFPRIEEITIDETGVGASVTDKFKVNTEWHVNGVKLTAQWNSDLYERTIRELLNGRVRYPSADNPNRRKFEDQWTQLVKVFKGNLMKCEPLDEDNGHDDYCDSLTLAIWGQKDEGRTHYRDVGTVGEMFKQQDLVASQVNSPDLGGWYDGQGIGNRDWWAF